MGYKEIPESSVSWKLREEYQVKKERGISGVEYC